MFDESLWQPQVQSAVIDKLYYYIFNFLVHFFLLPNLLGEYNKISILDYVFL